MSKKSDKLLMLAGVLMLAIFLVSIYLIDNKRGNRTLTPTEKAQVKAEVARCDKIADEVVGVLRPFTAEQVHAWVEAHARCTGILRGNEPLDIR
jgi:hypothetical protein